MEDGSIKPAIIFDFDGTLADSLYVTLRALYEIIHHKQLPLEDISRLRGMTMVQVLRELKIPLWRALFLMGPVHNSMRDQMDSVALVPGVDEMIRSLAETHRLFIASSNDVPNMLIFLQRFKLKAYFTNVYGGANPLRKAHLLRKVVRENGLHAKDTWYVGDQAWDVTAAHRAGMRAAAVAWGFSNLHVMQSRHPEVLVFSPDELTQYFVKNENSPRV